MAIYRITDGEELEQIPETSFEAEGIRERNEPSANAQRPA